MSSILMAYVFRGCGIAPSGTSSDKYFTVLVVVALGVSCFTIASSVLEIPELLQKSCFVIAVSLNRAAVAYIVAYTALNPKSYISIVHDLTTIDKQLRELGISKYQLIMQDNYLLLHLVTGSIILAILSLGKSLFGTIVSIMDNVLINAAIYQEIIFASRIHSRFSAINDHLACIAANSNTVEISHLVGVFKAHACLQAVVVDVDKHFCFHNLLRFTAKFVHSVFTMYEYITFISQERTYFLSNRVIKFVVQITYFICQALVCHTCSKEANRTVLLAHRVLKPDTRSSLWEEVALFSTLAIDNKIHFTIGGIFTLDRALVTNTALTALAYLIISVQLKDITLFQNIAQNSTSVVPGNATN